MDITEPEPKIDIKEALTKLRQLEQERDEAEAEMNAYLKELGFG